MARQRGQFEIIHASAFEIAVGHVEACRLDDVDMDAETRRHAQDRARIAGDVGLVERDAQLSSHRENTPTARKGEGNHG
jgi:hypothetical protein